jgi:tRNA 2-thiouridine synthesizing protein A
LKQIDVRGLSCPQPVILTKKALEESPEGLEILVEDLTAKTNIERFVRLSGYQVESKEEEESFLLKVGR